MDRLTIVAHDRFQAIIDEANRPGSPLHFHEVLVERDIGLTPRQTRIVQPAVLAALTPQPEAGPTQPLLPFDTHERKVAQATLTVIRDYERETRRVPGARALKAPDIQAEIIAKVTAAVTAADQVLPELTDQTAIAAVVARTLDFYAERSIDIPRIVVVPTGDVTTGYDDFPLELQGVALQPVPQDILIQHLRTQARELLATGHPGAAEERLEDYLVSALIDYDDLDYEAHADLLYELAGQMVRHLRSYLSQEPDVGNVLQYHQKRLAALIHTQMQAHRWERATGYDVQVSKGFETLRELALAAPVGEVVRDYRTPVENRQQIPNLLFGGFLRCLYPVQKFGSDPERRFAVLLEREPDELRLKWFKPARGQFKIFYAADQAYEPDFVVETATAKYLGEPKRADQINDREVQNKARAAAQWCRHATDYELAHGGKPWTYLLIPHDAINDSATLRSLAALCTFRDVEGTGIDPTASP